MHKALILFGNTNSGKTTLAKLLGEKMNCRYISFGDIKREEIRAGTELGKRLDRYIRLARPIDPEDGVELIRKHFVVGSLNVVCGFPISAEELHALTVFCSVVGVVDLRVSDKEIEHRYFGRGVCPVCFYPGIVGGKCPVHGIVLVARSDTSSSEFETRMRLYRTRIEPFLSSESMLMFPRITVDSEGMTANDVCNRVFCWAMKFGTMKGVDDEPEDLGICNKAQNNRRV